MLGLAILFMRLWIPESPRWLLIHGHRDQAARIVGNIERGFEHHGHVLAPLAPGASLRLRSRTHTPLREVLQVLLHTHRRRSLVGMALLTSQAFFYNAIFFTYALVLSQFYGREIGRASCRERV